MQDKSTDDPCAGHECDHCAICRKGRCCRRDNPHYELPEEGGWPGPIIGALGVLRDDGDKVECHMCGAWFGNLGNHAWRTHDVTPDEYRALFGLRATHGLVGPTCLAKHRAPENIERLARARPAESALKRITREQRQAASAARRTTAESKRDPRVVAARENALTAARRAYAAAAAAGTLPPRKALPPEVQARAAQKAAVTRVSHQAADPAWAAGVNRRIGDGNTKHGRYRADAAPVAVPCCVCGTVMSLPPSLIGHKTTCSDACNREHKRLVALKEQVTKRPDIRAKISASARQRSFLRNSKGQIVGVRPAPD